MAKELDWKSSKAATPRGFESRVLRQHVKSRANQYPAFYYVFCKHVYVVYIFLTAIICYYKKTDM